MAAFLGVAYKSRLAAALAFGFAFAFAFAFNFNLEAAAAFCKSALDLTTFTMVQASGYRKPKRTVGGAKIARDKNGYGALLHDLTND